MSKDTQYHIDVADALARIETLGESTLKQVEKTNGRVTKLEDVTASHATSLSLILQREADAGKRANWWKDKLGTALIGVAFAVVGGALMLVLQKTDIIDVSVVSPEEYDRIEVITAPYESNNR